MCYEIMLNILKVISAAEDRNYTSVEGAVIYIFRLPVSVEFAICYKN